MSPGMGPRTCTVLAGGKGMRLRPFTYSLPKPLMPVGKYEAARPVLAILLERLSACGFKRVIVCVGHQAELIKTYCGNGDKWEVEILYSEESEPLGTAGPILKCHRAGLLDEPFISVNGDTITDLDFGALHDFHIERPELVTAAVTRRRQKIDYGIVSVTKGDPPIIKRWREKPELLLPVAMGIYAISPEALEHLPPGCSDMPDLVQSNVTAVYYHDGEWLDIGRPEDYSRACAGFEAEDGTTSGSGLPAGTCPPAGGVD